MFNLKTEKFNDNEKATIGVELEKIVFKYIPDNIKRNVANLTIEDQIKMLKEVLDFICNKTKQGCVDLEIIKNHRVDAINEISREFCWIYRDWQTAIGDSMLKEITSANRRYDVIGFGDFQTAYEENMWLKKVDGLFTALDVSVDDKFDTRVQQLKQLFSATIKLIEAFKALIKNQETIPDKSFKALKDFDVKINNNTNPKKRKRLRVKYE